MCKDLLFLLEHKTLGNVDGDAIKSGKKRLSTSRQVVERKVELITTLLLARLYRSLCKYKEEKGLHLKALNIAEKIGDREIEASCYINLGIVFGSLGEYVKAQEHFEEALTIAEKIGDRKTEANFHADLGITFRSLGEYVKAKEHLEKALAIAEKIDDRETEAKCYVDLGGTFICLGEYVKAKEHFEKALAIAEKIGDVEKEANCHADLGITFRSVGEYVKAKEHLEKALAIAQKIDDRETEAKCYVDLGGTFICLGEYVKAKEHFEKALAIAEKIGDRKTEAICCINLGKILSQSHLGEYVKAKEHSEKALVIAEKIGDREVEASYYLTLGGFFLSSGEHVKSKECLEKALVLGRMRGNVERESFCDMLLSMCMFKEGNISEGKSNVFASLNKIEGIRRLQVHDKFKIAYFDRMVSDYRWHSTFLCNVDFLYEGFCIEEFGRARALTDLMAARYSVESETPVSLQTWYDIESIVKKECNCTCLYISNYGQLIMLWVVKPDNPLIFRQIEVNDFFGSVSSVADLLCREIYKEVLCLAPEQCEDRSWLPSNAYSEQGCERLMLEEDEVVSQQPDLTPASMSTKLSLLL